MVYTIVSDQCWQDDLQCVLNVNNSKDWKQRLYLREDLNLMNFAPLKQLHDNLDKKLNVKLTDLQEVNRINISLHCCPFLSAIHQHPIV